MKYTNYILENKEKVKQLYREIEEKVEAFLKENVTYKNIFNKAELGGRTILKLFTNEEFEKYKKETGDDYFELVRLMLETILYGRPFYTYLNQIYFSEGGGRADRLIAEAEKYGNDIWKNLREHIFKIHKNSETIILSKHVYRFEEERNREKIMEIYNELIRENYPHKKPFTYDELVYYLEHPGRKVKK